jgi:phytoene dehydrogenase-like protein
MYDAVVIGAGHNGLVCAAYLAKAKLRVCVVERPVRGRGAAVTEEFHPGFRNSTASYTVSLLHPKVIRDLRLAEHGLRIVERPYSNFLPLSDGEFIRVGGGLEATQREIERFSKEDARPAARVLREARNGRRRAARSAARNAAERRRGHSRPLPRVEDRAPPAGAAPRGTARGPRSLSRCPPATGSTAGSSRSRSRRPSDSTASVGNFASPYTPGSAYVLLHHVFGEVNGKKGTWGHAIGGMGAITQAMRREAESLGVEIRTGRGVERVRIEGETARGVVLQDGEEIAARCVVSNTNPRLLLDLLRDVPGEWRNAFENYQCESATLRMNCRAIGASGLHVPARERKRSPIHRSGIIMAAVARLHGSAPHATARGGWLVARADRRDADPDHDGRHARAAGQARGEPLLPALRYALPQGRRWDEEREKAADAVIDHVNQFAPNFKASVIAGDSTPRSTSSVSSASWGVTYSTESFP